MWTLACLDISAEERAELERRVRAYTAPQRMVRRCWVILLAAEGVASRRIGPEVGLSENQVGVWRRRFETERALRVRPGAAEAPRLLTVSATYIRSPDAKPVAVSASIPEM